MNWSFDISTAPRGRTVRTERQTPKGIRTVETFEPDILLMASVCGKVLRSYWVPATNHHDGYWAGFAQKGGTPPVAWMPWPDHPNMNPEAKASVDNAATIAPETATAGREMRVGAAPRGSVPATSDGGRDGVERHAPFAHPTPSQNITTKREEA